MVVLDEIAASGAAPVASARAASAAPTLDPGRREDHGTGDAISDATRVEGNARYKRKDFKGAEELYTLALSQADPVGELIPAILGNMVEKMQEEEVGAGREESIKQHTNRAKRLLQLLSAEGWTRNEIDNSSFQDVLDILQAAATRGDISDSYRQALRDTAKKYGLDIGYFQDS